MEFKKLWNLLNFKEHYSRKAFLGVVAAILTTHWSTLDMIKSELPRWAFLDVFYINIFDSGLKVGEPTLKAILTGIIVASILTFIYGFFLEKNTRKKHCQHIFIFFFIIIPWTQFWFLAVLTSSLNRLAINGSMLLPVNSFDIWVTFGGMCLLLMLITIAHIPIYRAIKIKWRFRYNSVVIPLTLAIIFYNTFDYATASIPDFLNVIKTDHIEKKMYSSPFAIRMKEGPSFQNCRELKKIKSVESENIFF